MRACFYDMYHQLMVDCCQPCPVLKNWRVSVDDLIAKHLKSEKYKSARKKIRDNKRYRRIRRGLVGKILVCPFAFCRSRSSVETVLDTLPDKGSTYIHIARGMFNFAANTDVNVYISQEG